MGILASPGTAVLPFRYLGIGGLLTDDSGVANRRSNRPSRIDAEARERALDALALSRRESMSLTHASKLTHTTPRTVLRYAGPAFRHEGRRYRPRNFDRIPRELHVLTPTGPEAVVVRDSRAASKLSAQANSVRAYLHWGDLDGLRDLRGHAVTIGGRRYQLALDPLTLDRLAEGGELHFELYRR